MDLTNKNREHLCRIVPLDSIIGQVTELRKSGAEWKGLCPIHNDNNPSFSIFTGDDGKDRYRCHACGAGGDAVGFLIEYHSLSYPEAMEMMLDLSGGAALESSSNQKRETYKAAPKQQVWEAIPADYEVPAPKKLDAPKDGKWVSTKVLGAWAYRSYDDLLLGYTCRIEPTPGKKEVLPMTHKVHKETGEMSLRAGALPIPRSLYGAEMLKKMPNSNVILVEGEKAAEAGRRLLGSFGVIVMTWPGGCKAVDKADWSMLHNRKVVGWPDCDSQRDNDGNLKPYIQQPGMAAMLRVAELLAEHNAPMRIVCVPQPGEGEGHWPAGYDFADLEGDGWTGAQVMEYLQTHMREPKDIAVTKKDDDLNPPELEDIPLDSYYDHHIPEGDPALELEVPESLVPVAPRQFIAQSNREPFRILGWDNGKAYYLSDSISQIVVLAASQHTSHNLFQLADLSYWQANHGVEKKSGIVVDYLEAAATLIKKAKAKMVFRPEMIRGRGAWWDKDKWAVHLGDRVVMGDGEFPPVTYELADIESKYIYQRSVPLNISFAEPLGSSESIKLCRLTERLLWDTPINGKLLAGYIFLAPICGALEWRPHIWITGGHGTGKSFVMEKYVTRILKGIGLILQGNTSEAGARQLLEHDALPIVWDEFESDNKKTEARTDDIMDMVTRASSESDAMLAKGGADGKATTYKTRSMFCFSSISVGIKNPAAESRISILGLVKVKKDEETVARFEQLRSDIDATFTPEFIQGLQARAIRMIPVIRKNATKFANALAKLKDDQRYGDQHGALIAGAYALYRTNEIDQDYADQYVKSQDWAKMQVDDKMSDDRLCLQRILSWQIKVETHEGVRTRTVSELIYLVMGKTEAIEDKIAPDEAKYALGRSGLVAFKDRSSGEWEFRVAKPHPEVTRMLDNTPWKVSYHKTLVRIPGSVEKKALDFAKQKINCTCIPMDQVFIVGAEED
jgi:putative DNA primase/helicase